MKKSSLIINVVLVVAVAVLYVLHFVNPSPKADSSEAGMEVSSALPTGGIVYIDIDSVISNYNMSADVTADLQNTLNTKEAQLQSKQRSFERNYTDFQNKINKGLVTRSEAAEIEQSLQFEQQTLMQLQQQMQYELAEQEAVAQRKVLNSIMEYLKSLENEQEYQFVLGTSFGGSVLYANDNLNITKNVIKGLNAEYEESKEE
ncbi:MAG TPA: hypothetical protein DDX98_00345 [Bacteroidales bacterium]|jgi:outer membrane protein|nr:hypothetical protein [Bacteroidales bacterium]